LISRDNKEIVRLITHSEFGCAIQVHLMSRISEKLTIITILLVIAEIMEV